MGSRPPYKEIKEMVEEHGGSMRHVREGFQWGAWIIRLGGKEMAFRSNGSGYPELDHLYVPKPGIRTPTHYKDYTNKLILWAWEKFFEMFSKREE